MGKTAVTTSFSAAEPRSAKARRWRCVRFKRENPPTILMRHSPMEKTEVQMLIVFRVPCLAAERQIRKPCHSCIGFRPFSSSEFASGRLMSYGGISLPMMRRRRPRCRQDYARSEAADARGAGNPIFEFVPQSKDRQRARGLALRRQNCCAPTRCMNEETVYPLLSPALALIGRLPPRAVDDANRHKGRQQTHPASDGAR